ncbi:MAG: RsmB/NOP family class I SAM-dependent RNA methyltransferase [Mycobacteriales bacterium]
MGSRPTRPGGRPPGRPRQATDPARRAALDTLTAVRRRDAYANLTLPALLTERRLTGRDAALATELAYGTLRAQGTLDAVLDACVNRSVDPAVRDLLRLGAYQLLRTAVPAYAAVSSTVALARTTAGEGPARFVNAVLRKVAARDWDGWVAALAPADPLDRLALATAHPRWIAAAFADALGEPVDGPLTGTAAALAADNARPLVHLVARPGRISRDELGTLAGGEPGRYSPFAVYLPGGAPAALAPVRDGRAGAQDEGSQLCALALAGAPLTGPDARWLDLCAGPGGKAALLGALAATGRDATLVAAEVQPHRARLVAQVTAGLPVQVVVADGRRGPWPDGGFDRVLLDAPCSGLGALRRRPEARWRRRPADLADLTALQRDLLAAALRAVRPGGVVAYVTCSPHPAETVAVVAAVIAATSDAEVLDTRPAFAGVPDLGPGPHVQLWPHRHGTDAMFCALLRRRSR